MAINTPKPISREEKYLSKIGGNEEVIVPKPISREEKYMYRAAGYDDQPIPDYPIGRNEKYWAKIVENGGGSEVGSTVAFDSRQKFISDNSSLKDYKIYGNGGEIHPTGVLPLTFTAKGGNAVDWRISGNAQGVGERTVNMIDATAFEAGVLNANGELVYPTGTTISTSLGRVAFTTTVSYRGATSDYINVDDENIGVSFVSENVSGCFWRYCFYDADKTFISKSDTFDQTVHSYTLTIPSNAKYVRIAIFLESAGTYEATSIIATEGSTAPQTYAPYGYQVPITVSQQGQTDKSVDIYIGDSPLTEGETVSKTSTGVDIELFEGENTVSTTLYNKPLMEIETSYGVGVKDNNHYIIPFKVNTTIYNIQIGDSPLYDGEYLSYKEKKLYKYIDSVLTPIDPPSPFPEISTTEGVNKVIIETSTQPDSIFITTQNPIKLVQPNIGTKTITQNGVYNASDDNLDGYSSVTVNTN